MLMAIEAVRGYTAGMDFKDFAADRKTVDAVVRNLIIIGEAASRVPDEVCLGHPGIPCHFGLREATKLVFHQKESHCIQIAIFP